MLGTFGPPFGTCTPRKPKINLNLWSLPMTTMLKFSEGMVKLNYKLVKKMLMTTNHMINTKEKIGGCIKSDTKLMVHNKGKHGENWIWCSQNSRSLHDCIKNIYIIYQTKFKLSFYNQSFHIYLKKKKRNSLTNY